MWHKLWPVTTFWLQSDRTACGSVLAVKLHLLCPRLHTAQLFTALRRVGGSRHPSGFVAGAAPGAANLMPPQAEEGMVSLHSPRGVPLTTKLLHVFLFWIYFWNKTMRSAQRAIAKASLRRGFGAEGPECKGSACLLTAQTWKSEFQGREGIADMIGIFY